MVEREGGEERERVRVKQRESEGLERVFLDVRHRVVVQSLPARESECVCVGEGGRERGRERERQRERRCCSSASGPHKCTRGNVCQWDHSQILSQKTRQKSAIWANPGE